MKVPMIFLLLLLLFIPLTVGAYLKGAPPPTGIGVVMGRDFAALLSNPNLRLTVEEAAGRATLVWSTDDPKLMASAREMGEFMVAMKHYQEPSVGRWPKGESLESQAGARFSTK